MLMMASDTYNQSDMIDIHATGRTNGNREKPSQHQICDDSVKEDKIASWQLVSKSGSNKDDFSLNTGNEQVVDPNTLYVQVIQMDSSEAEPFMAVTPTIDESSSSHFTSSESIRHMEYTNKTSAKLHSYKCEYCLRTFCKKAALVSHTKTHTAVGLFTCTICQKTFRSEVGLKVHSKVHLQFQEYTCGVCNEEFSDLKQMEEHHEMHIQTSRGASEGTSSNRHELTSGYVGGGTDEYLNITIKKEISHDNSHLLSEKKAVKKTREHEHPFQCDVGDESVINELSHKEEQKTSLQGVCKTSSSDGLNGGSEQVLDSNSLCVQIVQMGFTNAGSDESESFISIAPIIDETHETSAKPLFLRCNHCLRTFHNKAALVSHTKTHTAVGIFPCTVCQRTFRSEVGLKVHSKVHLQFLKYICSICNKEFSDLKQMELHHETHDQTSRKNTDTFQCDFCEDTYVTFAELYEHLKSHSHQCTTCEASFYSADELRLHAYIHRNETLFVCTICNFLFESRKLLEAHKVEKHPVIIRPSLEHHFLESDICIQEEQLTEDQNDLLTMLSNVSQPYVLLHDIFKRDPTVSHNKRQIRCDGASYNEDETGNEPFPTLQKFPANADRCHSQHRNLSKPTRPYMCTYEGCPKAFKTFHNLRAHLHVHSNQKALQCDVCHKLFSRSDYFQKHYRIHTNTRPYECPEKNCGKKFIVAGHLKSHMILHSGERKFECSICHSRFAFLGRLNEHMKSHSEARPHLCSICKKGFKTKAQCDTHEKIHTGIKPFVCEVDDCRKSFVSAGDLKKHSRIHTGEKPFKCSLCDRAFTVNCDLKIHMRRHTGEKPFKCSECPKTFISIEQCKMHHRTHTGEKPYKCNICGRGFVQGTHLKRHLLTHSGEKAHSCLLCDRAFARPESLAQHMRSHLGEKRYECTICHKKFSQRQHLKTHSAMHSGDKPYKCLECDKTFVSPGALSCHNRTHSGDKPYKCKFCGMMFRYRSNCSAHTRIHTKEKPYECRICGRRFSDASNHKRHVARHKPNEGLVRNMPTSKSASAKTALRPSSSGGEKVSDVRQSVKLKLKYVEVEEDETEEDDSEGETGGFGNVVVKLGRIHEDLAGNSSRGGMKEQDGMIGEDLEDEDADIDIITGDDSDLLDIGLDTSLPYT